jgi:drug/metabolite transporter (DMT)-like permease
LQPLGDGAAASGCGRKKRKIRQLRANCASPDNAHRAPRRILSGMNTLLYILTVLIWGTTWIAIKFQLGVVAAPVSIAYRFWIASMLLMMIQYVMGKPLWPPRAAWRYLWAQGFALFCLNFLFFYNAARWVPSGLVAVVFSTAPIWNAINGRLFMKRPIRPQVMGGAALGLCGIALLFLPQMAGHWNDSGMLLGLGLAVCGTLCFSTGNLLSSRMQELGLTPWLTNTWAMMIGAAILTVGALALDMPFNFDPNPRYMAALLYLAIPGSVIAFTAYLLLVGRLGPDRAGYSTVLFPVVALTVSTFVEGYRWNAAALGGLLLVLCGNLLAFLPAGAYFFSKTRSQTP